MQIQFLYEDGCPYTGLARSALSEALIEFGGSVYVDEIRIISEEQARKYALSGSPTIRINGRDIVPNTGHRLGCRAYLSDSGNPQGWPDKETILWALESALTPIGCCG